MNGLNELPNEIILYRVFPHLNYKEIVYSLSSVNHHFLDLSRDDLAWQNVCITVLPDKQESSALNFFLKLDLYYDYFLEALSSSGSTVVIDCEDTVVRRRVLEIKKPSALNKSKIK